VDRSAACRVFAGTSAIPGGAEPPDATDSMRSSVALLAINPRNLANAADPSAADPSAATIARICASSRDSISTRRTDHAVTNATGCACRGVRWAAAAEPSSIEPARATTSATSLE
jgi:hypothetical protein